MCESSRKSGMKKIYGLLLSFALVFCFYGVSFSEQQVIQNLESTIVEMAPGAFEAKLQQIVPLATRGANYSVGGLYTCNTASVEFLMPIKYLLRRRRYLFCIPGLLWERWWVYKIYYAVGFVRWSGSKGLCE